MNDIPMNHAPIIDFLDFIVWGVQQFVSFLFDIPLFTDGFHASYGDGLVALGLIMIIVVAFVRSVSAVNLSDEARVHGYRDFRAQRLNSRKGKKG